MQIRKIHTIINIFIATVWLANGLFCKVLNLVPRHLQIVASILGDEYARFLTFLIGMAEIGMAFWILTQLKSKQNAILQILVIASMNILEFTFVPDLLLWGRFNIVFALLFISIIYYNEFVLRKKLNQLHRI